MARAGTISDGESPLAPPVAERIEIENYKVLSAFILDKRTQRWAIGAKLGEECRTNLRLCSLGLLSADIGGKWECTTPAEQNGPVIADGITIAEKLETATAVKTTRVHGWFDSMRVGMPCRCAEARCTLNLICAGPAGAQECRFPVQDGEMCDNNYHVSVKKSICEDGKCKYIVPEGGSCGCSKAMCREDSFCTLTEHVC